MRKTIEAKFLTYESAFGTGVFMNVPVSVDSTVDLETFNTKTDDYALRGDIIQLLEREMARIWLREYLKRDVDGNHIRRWQLSRDEARALAQIFGFNGTEFGRLIGQTKGKVSKIFAGEQAMSPPVVTLVVKVLIDELKHPGYARASLDQIPEVKEKALRPVMDFHEISKRRA